MGQIYSICSKELKWSLKDLDDTDLETLIDFLYFKEVKDPNTKIINGKTFRRAQSVPSWL